MARMKSKRTWDSGRLPLLDDHQVANRADARSTRSSQSKRGSTDRPGRHRRARSYSMTSSRGSSNSPPAARVKTRHPSERDRPLLDEGRQPYHGHLRGAPLITRRPPSPSQMSIFSDQTQRTGFSSESNKTITQESYDRAQKRPSERFDIFQFLEPEPPQDDNEGVQRAEDKKDDVINGSKSASLEQDGADGHEPPYDEEEEDVDEEDWLSGSDDEDATPQDLVPRHRPLTPNSDARSVRSSGLWDSGISMGGDSPEVVKRERVALPATIHDLSDPTTPVKPPAAPQREGLGPHDALQRLQSPSPGRMQQSRASPSTHSSSARDLSGYELIAWSLSSRSTKAKGDQTLPPVYRNFEQLQHRTLLHLQDTIAEIEMEIRKLDESIAPYFVDATGGRHPQSRRYDRLRMHTIGAQRHQLLDGLSHYLAQYSMFNLLARLNPAIANSGDRPTPLVFQKHRFWACYQRANYHLQTLSA